MTGEMNDYKFVSQTFCYNTRNEAVDYFVCFGDSFGSLGGEATVVALPVDY